MGKTEAPKTISRYTLIMTLQRQYNGNSPFVIQKDGKEIYNYMTDKISFTCCKKIDHIHSMSPFRILQLVYIYGANPCPICNPKGLRYKKKDKKEKDSFGQEDGSIMSETKKYLESSDPSETAKRLSDLQIEIEEEKRKTKELEKKKKESEEDIVESIPFDDYIKNENPNFNPDKITITDSNNNIEEKTVEEIKTEVISLNDDEDSDIVESETYEEYVLKNPDYNEKIIGNEMLNKKPKSIFDLDYIFNKGVEEGSVFAIGDEDVQENNQITKRNNTNISNQNLNNKIEKKEMQEIVRKNNNTNIAKLADETKNENLNEDNTNILLTESNENEKTSSNDEDEEEFSF